MTELMLGAELRRRAAVLFTGAMHFVDHPAKDGASNLFFAALGTTERHRRPRRASCMARDAPPRPLGPQSRRSGRRPLRKRGPVAPWRLPARARACRRDRRQVAEGRPATASRDSRGLGGPRLGGDRCRPRPELLPPRHRGARCKWRPVVLASRCRDIERYEESQAGALHAGDLTAEKAAIALMVGLGRHRDLAKLRAWAQLLVAGRPAAETTPRRAEDASVPTPHLQNLGDRPASERTDCP